MKCLSFMGVAALLLLCSCEKFMEKKYTVMLDNKTSSRLYIAVGMETEGHAGIYPDTSLPVNKPIFSEAAPQSTGYILYASDKIDKLFEALPKDTLSVYLFNADSVDALGWNVIQSQNKLLKRLDLSLEDVKNRNYVVQYP